MALQIADAMGLSAEDVSQEEFNAQYHADGGANADHMIGGMLGTDPTMLVLGAFAQPTPGRTVQVVAWVPHDQASDGDAAVQLTLSAAQQAWLRLREASLGPQEDPNAGWRPSYMGLPFGDMGLKSAKQVYQMLNGYTPSLIEAPAFMASGQQYWGPIFIGNIIGADGAQAFSRDVPAWFYVYDPGQGRRPRAIYNAGKAHYFVTPSASVHP